MQAGYFSTVWRDVKESPGWFGRLCLLGLLSFIPIFGQIVLLGYSYGWARDIAWNMRTSMPARIFGNEDGRLYSRGLHMFVIALVFGIVPYVLQQAWAKMAGGGFGAASSLAFGADAGSLMFSLLACVVVLALMVFCTIFSYVGSIRSTVYCRLSPGFQLKRLWSMFRYDVSGIVRIFFMVLLVTAISTAVFCGGIFSLSFFMVSGPALLSDSPVLMPLFLAGALLMLALFFAYMVATAFTIVIEARALGYWVAQFDVPSWRGEDDPMPFELVGASQG